jgi:hypothetical protein
MRTGSTGLGKTELSFNLISVNRQEKEILIRGKTYDPVIWDLRIIITPEDVPTMLKLLSEDTVITTIQEWLKELDQKQLSTYFDALQIVLAKLPDILRMITDKNVLVIAFEALAGLNKEQVASFFNVVKKLLAAESEFDTFLRAASIPLRSGTNVAILLLDENRKDLLSGLLVHIKGGVFPSIPEGIDFIEKIDLNFELDGKKLKETFKPEATPNAARNASQLIQSKYGGPLLTMVIDIRTLNEVFNALPIRVGKVDGELFNEVIRLMTNKFLRGEITIEPVPHLLNTVQKISLAV